MNKNLRIHIEYVHDGKKKYPCDKCNYQATRKDTLKNHKDTVHEGRKYPCGLCDFQATQKQILNTHKTKVHNHIGM